MDANGGLDSYPPSRMLGYLLSGSEAQRDAVADELDNDLIQIAAALDVRAGILARRVQTLGDPELTTAVGEVRSMVGELRSGLRRAVLLLGAAHAPTGDLEVALRDLGARATVGEEMQFEVEVKSDSAVPTTISGVVYRVAQEAVSAAIALGTVRAIRISVSSSPSHWYVEVTASGGQYRGALAHGPVTRSMERLTEYIHGMDGSVEVVDDGELRVIAQIPLNQTSIPAWLDLAADAQRVLDALSLGVVVADTQWRVLFANVAAARLLGRSPAQVEGMILWDLSPDFASSTFRQLLTDALAGQYEGNFMPDSDLPIKRVWFNPSPFGTLLQFDEVITD